LSFIYQAVERIPKQLDSNVVYHNQDFELATLLCACGCGHRVTLLVPDSRQVYSEGGLATVTPSIAVCDAPCKSHYVITGGRIHWLPAFSNAQAKSVMRGQIARHAGLAKRQSWIDRVRVAIVNTFNKLKSIFLRG
jgi:hypothetical protein